MSADCSDPELSFAHLEMTRLISFAALYLRDALTRT